MKICNRCGITIYAGGSHSCNHHTCYSQQLPSTTTTKKEVKCISTPELIYYSKSELLQPLERIAVALEKLVEKREQEKMGEQ